jgi:hypothetical protein
VVGRYDFVSSGWRDRPYGIFILERALIPKRSIWTDCVLGGETGDTPALAVAQRPEEAEEQVGGG